MAKKSDKSKKTIELKSSETTGEKIFLYLVNVFDKNKNLLKTHKDLTSADIKELKLSLKDGEYVKYMPINIKK